MTASNAPMLELEVQYAVENETVPTQASIRCWVEAALRNVDKPVELVIRIVGEMESRELNSRYRGKNASTNVLSFPFEAPPGVASNHLGDVVICAPVVTLQALKQHKQESDHWAHLVIHGVLHLLGYDHQSDKQAQEMELLETQILEGLGVNDPYRPTGEAL